MTTFDATLFSQIRSRGFTRKIRLEMSIQATCAPGNPFLHLEDLTEAVARLIKRRKELS